MSDAREVTLDGKVNVPEDSVLAESVAYSVDGVAYVKNRLMVVPVVVPVAPTPESSDALISRGRALLDTGDYPAAIDCFRKALADPNNKGAGSAGSCRTTAAGE